MSRVISYLVPLFLVLFAYGCSSDEDATPEEATEATADGTPADTANTTSGMTETGNPMNGNGGSYNRELALDFGRKIELQAGHWKKNGMFGWFQNFGLTVGADQHGHKIYIMGTPITEQQWWATEGTLPQHTDPNSCSNGGLALVNGGQHLICADKPVTVSSRQAAEGFAQKLTRVARQQGRRVTFSVASSENLQNLPSGHTPRSQWELTKDSDAQQSMENKGFTFRLVCTEE